MLAELIAKIATQMIPSTGEHLEPPCPEREILKVKRDSLKKLGIPVPEEYLDFLRLTNGMNWNGTSVYASKVKRSLKPRYFVEGFVEGNLDYREPGGMDDYLIFANDGDLFWVYNSIEHTFESMSICGSNVFETFDTFEDLITNALTSVK